MYLRHSATCLSSITLNYVFIWNWMCLEVLLSFHFDWYLFPLVFCSWKVAEFQANTSQRDIKVKLNRSCAAMPPLLLEKERNKLVLFILQSPFFLFISLQIPHFIYQPLLFCLKIIITFLQVWKPISCEMKVPFHSLNGL